MEGATVAGDIVARATAATQAGCDMVLVCNRPDLADDLLKRWHPEISPRLPDRLETLKPAQYPAMESLSVDQRFMQAWHSLQTLA
jgi:beta-N-acetylhexosaminidase